MKEAINMIGKHLKKTCAAVLSAAVFAASISITAALPAKAEIDVAAEFPFLTAPQGMTIERVREIVGLIYEGLENRSERIYIGGTQDEYSNYANFYGQLYMEVAENRDIGLVVQSNSVKYGFNGQRGSFIIPLYLDDNGAFDEYYGILDDIRGKVGENWSDYEKALYLHDYLASHYDYDYEHVDDNDYMPQYIAYGMMQNGKGVCNAYAMMYCYLLNSLGVRTEMVSADSIAHAWNVVYLEGKLYHVDITWDDSNHGGFAGLMSHDNFLRTTDEMIDTGHVPNGYNAGDNLDWELLCGTSIYDLDVITTPVSNDVAFWDDVNSTIVPIEGQTSDDVKWVATHSTGQSAYINICDDADLNTLLASSNITTFADKWYIPNTNSYYPGVFTTLEVCDNVLFYTDSQHIYAYYDGHIETVKELDDAQLDEGRIYGMRICNGELCYYLCDMPYTYDPYADDVTTEYSVGEAQSIADTIKAKYGLSYNTNAKLSETITINVCLDLTKSLTRETVSPNDAVEIAVGNNIQTVSIPDLPTAYFNIDGTGEKLYRYYALELSPRMMDANITFTLCCGDARGSVYSFTGSEYLERVMDMTEATDNDHVMADSTQIYSAYANEYFDSDSNSVNALSDAQTQAVENVAAPQDNRSYSGSLPSGVYYSGSTLMMRNKVSVRHYFRLASGKTLSVNDANGNPLTVYSKADEDGDTVYYVELPAVSPDKLGELATVTVNGTYSISYSPYCYASAKINSENTSPELKSLLKAMCLYGSAAENYNS